MKPEVARNPRFSRFPTVLLVSRSASARREAVYRAAPQSLSRAFFSLSNIFRRTPKLAFEFAIELLPGLTGPASSHRPSIIRHSISQIANKAPACRAGDGDNMIDPENVNEHRCSGNLG